MPEYNGEDIYCDLIIPKLIDIEIVKETDNIVAFYHTKPYWQVHIVVTPKKHMASLLELDDSNRDVGAELLSVVQELSANVNKDKGGCRVLTNLGNYQDSKHLHFHISSGKQIR